MTLARRIIPRLDTDGSRMVQRADFHNLPDSGDPAELAARFHEEGADELAVFDKVDSQDPHPIFLDTVRRISAQIQIPLMARCSIRTVQEAHRVLRAGADKLVVHSADAYDQNFITQLSEEFGSQAVVLEIRAKRNEHNDSWRVVAPAGGEASSDDVVEWACEGVRRGAGELLLRSAERDGAREGFDCGLIAAVSREVIVPVIASGGAGTPDDFLEVFTDGRADAAMAASMFQEGTSSIRTLKQYLESRAILVRT